MSSSRLFWQDSCGGADTPLEVAREGEEEEEEEEGGGSSSKRPRYQSEEGGPDLPHAFVHAFVGGAATQDLFGGLTASSSSLIVSSTTPELSSDSTEAVDKSATTAGAAGAAATALATASATAASSQRLVAALVLAALAHEARLSMGAVHHDETVDGGAESSTMETSTLAPQTSTSEAATAAVGRVMASRRAQRPTALWARVWVEHETDSAGRLKVNSIYN